MRRTGTQRGRFSLRINAEKRRTDTVIYAPPKRCAAGPHIARPLPQFIGARKNGRPAAYDCKRRARTVLDKRQP